ncbi:uncharacterized protein LOC129312989 [Prosopis cineraria]|uniref:uncharacterized protein LOC129312989 n=1 Tax=Prosopis cineraria TaxID=364024 RepID=UPI00240F945B|nr:uncharacterized protein LOC129312989 [Prosopis cineraria]
MSTSRNSISPTGLSGQISSFQQPPKNISIMNVRLKGQSTIDSQTQQDLMHDQKEKKIPLDVKVNVPLTIVIHSTRLKEISIVVKFKLTVDNLHPAIKRGYDDWNRSSRI